MSDPQRFRPAILMGVRLDVEAWPDRFTMKRPMRKPVEVRVGDIRHLGLDRGVSHKGLAGSSITLYLRTDRGLVRQPVDVNDAETQRFLSWLGSVAPEADVSRKPWPIAAQLLGVGAGMRLWSNGLFVAGIAFIVAGLVFATMNTLPVVGSGSGSRAFAAGYRAAPFVVIAVGVALAVLGWRRHRKRERENADQAKAHRFD